MTSSRGGQVYTIDKEPFLLIESYGGQSYILLSSEK